MTDQEIRLKLGEKSRELAKLNKSDDKSNNAIKIAIEMIELLDIECKFESRNYNNGYHNALRDIKSLLELSLDESI